MRVMEFNFNNVAIRLIDTSSNTERNQRLEEPLKRFFKEIERERYGINGQTGRERNREIKEI